ncbi:hypothetical protein OKW37_005112 [Paraburkholderia sp. MM5482-R2]
MHTWQKFFGVLAPRRRGPLATAVMDVTILLQPPVTLPGIGDDRRPGLDVIQHEGAKRFRGGIRHGRHSTAPESLRLHDLDRDTRQDLLPFGTASRKSGFFASDVGFVHLHLPAKALPIGANQNRPQAMKNSPHRLVGADLQGPLQTQRGDPIFSGSKMPTDRKPNRERSTCPVKDGASHHRCAATASSTHEPVVPKPPSSVMPTGRADEAARPSQPFEVVQAVCISREPGLKLPKGLRVVDAGVGAFHCPSLRLTPVKWTPHTTEIGRHFLSRAVEDAHDPILRYSHVTGLRGGNGAAAYAAAPAAGHQTGRSSHRIRG